MLKASGSRSYGEYQYLDYRINFNLQSNLAHSDISNDLINKFSNSISEYVKYGNKDQSRFTGSVANFDIPQNEIAIYHPESYIFTNYLKYGHLYPTGHIILVGTEPRYSPPVAHDGNATVVQGKSVVIQLTATDNNPDDILRLEIVNQPSKGQLSEINREAGVVTYTPNTNIVGPDTDSFTFKVNDGTLDSDPATITIRIDPLVT
ncbi:MAG: Ig-like domain-containing protein [Nitrososphaeraceae archaeon]|nr:Ig-like domain-containing protein [Nitrososphaeraceae archaeon]